MLVILPGCNSRFLIPDFSTHSCLYAANNHACHICPLRWILNNALSELFYALCICRNTEVVNYAFSPANCALTSTQHYCVLQFKNGLIDTAPGTSSLSLCYFGGGDPLTFGFVGFLSTDASGPYYITNALSPAACITQQACGMVSAVCGCVCVYIYI